MPTGIELSAGILTGTNKPVDSKYGPYTSTAAALADITASLRYQGLTVGITTASGVVEYWFKAGVADADFVEKTTGAVGVPAGALIISKTYAELKALKNASQLVSGQYYKITDFQLKWWNISINDNTVKTSAYVEPLNVLAISSNKFSTTASSDLYPTDIIYYDFESVTSASWGPGDLNYKPIPDFKGDIFRRIDPLKDIDICYDWRHITVNCCRPDLSQITTWSPTLTFNQYDAVKYNGKLFISTIDNNTAETNNSFFWEPFSDYNEEFTYFPTDESFCLTLVKPVKGFTDFNNYNSYLSNNPNTAYIFNVPPLTSTRVQKYTFNDNAEGVGNRSFHSASVKLGLNSHSNLFCGYGGFTDLGIRASFNIFGEAYKSINAVTEFQRNIIGRFVENNSFGSDVRMNQFSNLFTQNKLGDGIIYNKFSRRQMGNIFDNQVIGNIFCSGMDSNKFGTTIIGNFLRSGFQKNNLSLIFCGNDLWFSFGYNTTLGSFTDNNSRTGSVSANTFGGGCTKNSFLTFEKNEIGINCQNNIFPLYCLVNKIAAEFANNTSTSSAIASGEMYYNIINMAFQSNIIGSVFRMNEIGTYTYGCNFGNSFRRNKITNGDYNGYAGGWNVVGINFSSATHVANNYDKTLFKNAASQLKLAYYNAADQLIVTSPTA
jgi:hypothetical protein